MQGEQRWLVKAQESTSAMNVLGQVGLASRAVLVGRRNACAAERERHKGRKQHDIALLVELHCQPCRCVIGC